MPSPTTAYEAARASTVLVQVGDETTGYGYGSGVIVRRVDRKTQQPTVFCWTAGHVAKDQTNVTVMQSLRIQGIEISRYSFKASVVFVDMDYDLALLRLDRVPDVFANYATFEKGTLSIGEPIFHVGNILGPNFEAMMTVGVLSQFDVSPSLEGWPWPRTLDATCTIAYPGSSGGPLFHSADGDVIGLVVGGIGPGVTVYVPARDMLECARKHNVEWAVLELQF